MQDNTYIPAATAEKLNTIHPPGTRHHAAMQIAIPLIGNGLAPEAVVAQLQQKFSPGLSDKEIINIVQWCVAKKPTPSGYGIKPPSAAQWTPRQVPVHPVKVIPPTEKMDWWLSGHRVSPDKMAANSPLPVEQDNRAMCRQFMSLYGDQEHVNIVCKFTIEGDKVRPDGAGRCLTPSGWTQFIEQKGVPQSEAGAWVRMNPVKPVGSGKGGAITDADVTSHRFILLESDKIEVEAQLAFYSLIQLPIAIVVLSGGDSAHAWVRVDAETQEDYQNVVARLIGALQPFGFDACNKNTSRLSRLPGSQRTRGSKDGGLQRLVWFAHDAQPLKLDDLTGIEESLTLPAVHERPLSALVRTSADRYNYLIANRGKLGVMTGFAKIDSISGGLKGGQTTVVAGETGAGKSTVGLNIIHNALNEGKGVLLFTLEMDRDEIVDLLLSMKGKINRNGFNTGYFEEHEEARLIDTLHVIAGLPLWIEDAPSQTFEQIRIRTLQLARQKKIDLVVVDYIGLIQPDDVRAPREQQVALLSRQLRVLAKEAKLPVVILSQLNDEGKLRESRAVGHEANNVIVIETDPTNPSKLTLVVVKGRKIPKGRHEMEFDYLHALIKNKSIIEERDVPRR